MWMFLLGFVVGANVGLLVFAMCAMRLARVRVDG